ncbi:hypothetical protein ACIF8W_28595 [Streptomyces sp. NPDC085639]|uniref:hypothetical protein n=1 Tax=Streptomyces sp. NPDC085639 TaxID=3365734 RepID=UPI0037CE052B
METAEDPLARLRVARAEAERLNTEYRQAIVTVFKRATFVCRRGGDIDAVLAEVQLLKPGRRVNESPWADAPVADTGAGEADLKERVKDWYLALPDEVRHTWSTEAFVGHRGTRD